MPSTDLGNQEASFPAQPWPLLQVPVVCPIFPRNTPPFGPGSGRPREPRLRAHRTPRAAGARPARLRCPCLSTRMPVAPELGCGRPGSKHHRAACGGAGSPPSPPRALPCEREEEAGGRLRRGGGERLPQWPSSRRRAPRPPRPSGGGRSRARAAAQPAPHPRRRRRPPPAALSALHPSRRALRVCGPAPLRTHPASSRSPFLCNNTRARGDDSHPSLPGLGAADLSAPGPGPLADPGPPLGALLG